LRAESKIIVVNSVNNVSPSAGETNLVQAIQLLEDGDTIRFNIPGIGPFYLATPPQSPENGYPAITNHNVTIDGYSQPGSAPNENSILSSNNAKILIVMDSRNSPGHVENIPSYSTSEASTLFIKGATNVTIRGLCFLGPGLGDETPENPFTYAVSFAVGANDGKVQGCRIGLDVDGTNVYRFRCGITAFQETIFANSLTIGVAKNAVDPTTARGQFNLIMGEFIPVILEGANDRISGNFLNVFPDGVTDFNINGQPPNNLEAMIEIGRAGENLVIGTDGDGHNDAEERNIFGGVTVCDDSQILEWYGGTKTNMIVAGNYFGMGVDGATRFTNSMKVFGGLGKIATVRIGSDFNGVSDDVEGNLIAMNFPFENLFPAPSRPGPPLFSDASPGTIVSFRGNCLLGNNIAPYSYADGFQTYLTKFTNFYKPFLVTNQITPILFPTATENRIRGSCALGLAPYTNVFLDFYLADEEGWTNGQKFELTELALPGGGFAGFAQGKTYLGSFVENGPQDLNPTPGQFEFDVTSLNLTSQFITVSASYSSQPAGTTNGLAQTTPFANPITVQWLPRINIRCLGNSVTLSWPTNFGLFTIQSTDTLSPAAWSDMDPQPTITQNGNQNEASVSVVESMKFFRLKR
jgi:hypothetical protein